jgi:divalent metal cation (Fe/Co/Zn/Cd) transporter
MKEINPLKISLPEQVRKLYSFALTLAIITVVYNLAEGLVSVFFSLRGETLTLFGFGADSFVETISALGVTQMIVRIKMNPDSDKGRFEILALKITGWCFYVLAGILAISAVFDVVEGHQPTSTVPGIIIALISILCMWALIYFKLSVGKKLNSAPIISDAKCSQVCLYMSLVLLAASALWYFFKIPYIDIVGTAGLIYFSVKEGHEAFEKAEGIEECCD